MKQFPTPQLKNLIPGIPQIPQMQMPDLKGGVSISGGNTFGNVLADMLGKVNDSMGKAEQLTHDAVTTGKVNLHEVMIAMQEEEIALGLTTQVAGKFISTIEKLTQMQI